MSVSKKIPVLALLLLLAAAGPAGAQITHLGGTQMSGWVGRNNLAFDPINKVYLSIVFRAPVVGRFLDENGAQIGSDFVIATEPGYTAWASIAFGGPPNDPVFLVTYLKVMDSVNHSKFARFVRYVPGAPSVGGPILVTPVLDEWGFSEKAQSVWNGSRFVVGTRIRYVGVPIPTFQVNTLDLNGNVSAPVDLGDGQDYYGSPSVACSVGDANINTCMAVGFKAGYTTGYSGGSYGRLFNMTTLTPITGLFHVQPTGANEDQQVVFQKHNGRFLAEWLWGSSSGALIQTRLVNLDGSMSVLDPARAFAGPGAGSNTISYSETTRTTLIATKAGNAAQLFAFELGDDGYPLNPNNAILIANWDGTVQDYTPSIAANNGRGEWLVTAVLTSSTLVHRIQGVSSGGVTLSQTSWTAPTFGGSQAVALTASVGTSWNAASSAGVWLTVSPGSGSGTGNLVLQAAPNSSTAARTGTVSVGGKSISVFQPGQTVMPIGFPVMHLNGDAGGDVLASKASTGLWARLLGQGGGGFAESNGNWGQGFQPLAMEFNGDSLADVFLSNSTTGAWVKLVNTGAGFAPIGSGAWWPGWQKHVLDLNGDGLSDLFLYDPGSGFWYKAISTSDGFIYEQSQWSPGWEITPLNLNGDAFGDMFLFNRSTGRWFWVLGQNGGFSYPSSGFWAPVWDRYPGDFNGDGLDDLLLHDPSTGQVYVSFNVGGSFYFISQIWQLGWTPHVADLDGDGADDLLLHHASTGRWFKYISNRQGGFTDVGGGTWVLGWQIYPTDFNGDGRKDFLVYNPQTGAWSQCLNLVNNTFTYIGGQWQPGLTISVGATVR